MSTTARTTPLWVYPRRGLGTLRKRLRERDCRIAYLGASVTAQHDGYRPRLHENLINDSGRTHRAINAGIGGVGSITGVFLMDELVLKHLPDLCFVELTTGDSANEANLARVGAVAEGIIRKLYSIGCQVVVLHGHRNEDEGPQRHAAAVAQWEAVAEHYGIPSMHLHRLVASHLADDTLSEPLWFRDAVHTTAAGADFLAAATLEGLTYLGAADAPTWLPPARSAEHFGATRLVPVVPSMADDPAACSHGNFRFFYPWLGVESGNGLSLQSEEEVVGLLVVVGTDAGVLEIETEHGHETISAFDEWCHYDRLNAIIFRTPSPRHQVRVSLSDRPVDRSMVRHPLAAEATTRQRLRAIAWMVRSEPHG